MPLSSSIRHSPCVAKLDFLAIPYIRSTGLFPALATAETRDGLLELSSSIWSMAAASATYGLASRPMLDPKAAAVSRAPIRPHPVSLPALPQIMPSKLASCGRTASRSVIAVATGDSPAEASTELPEFVATVKEVWSKLDDKYAVASLAFVGLIALWGAVGMISAIDRLPIIPGVLELVGIGYTGWFVYGNLIKEPDREALVEKVKTTYSDIIGSSS